MFSVFVKYIAPHSLSELYTIWKASSYGYLPLYKHILSLWDSLQNGTGLPEVASILYSVHSLSPVLFHLCILIAADPKRSFHGWYESVTWKVMSLHTPKTLVLGCHARDGSCQSLEKSVLLVFSKSELVHLWLSSSSLWGPKLFQGACCG